MLPYLTDVQKAENEKISSDRVKNEHSMSGIKRLMVVKDKLKVLTNDFRDAVMEIVCGILNFRLQFKPWKYPELKTNLQ